MSGEGSSILGINRITARVAVVTSLAAIARLRRCLAVILIGLFRHSDIGQVDIDGVAAARNAAIHQP